MMLMIARAPAVLLALAITTHVSAQAFEGVITWALTHRVSGEAGRALRDQPPRTVSDAETTAWRREVDSLMARPEYKNNPALKAKIENMIKILERGGQADAMLPTGYVFKTRKGNHLTKIAGGIMDGAEVLVLKGSNDTYLIDRAGKTYSLLPDTPASAPETVTVRKTSETMDILGYPCTKYIAEATVHRQTVVKILWTTTAVKNLDMKSFMQYGLRSDMEGYDQVRGFPLRIEVLKADVYSVLEVVALTPQKVPASYFKLPEGFTQTPWKF